MAKSCRIRFNNLSGFKKLKICRKLGSILEHNINLLSKFKNLINKPIVLVNLRYKFTLKMFKIGKMLASLLKRETLRIYKSSVTCRIL
jgi:hypothetical protein